VACAKFSLTDQYGWPIRNNHFPFHQGLKTRLSTPPSQLGYESKLYLKKHLMKVIHCRN
jgi:hypothetical protein